MDTFVTEKHLQQHYRMRSFKGECFWAHFALFAIKREIQRALSEVTSLRNVCRLASTTNPENIEYTRLWTVFRWLLSPTQNQAAHHSPPVPTTQLICTHCWGDNIFRPMFLSCKTGSRYGLEVRANAVKWQATLAYCFCFDESLQVADEALLTSPDTQTHIVGGPEVWLL